MEKLGKSVFSYLKDIKFQKKQKFLVIASKTASEQPLFAVPELNPHPVDLGLDSNDVIHPPFHQCVHSAMHRVSACICSKNPTFRTWVP